MIATFRAHLTLSVINGETNVSSFSLFNFLLSVIVPNSLLSAEYYCINLRVCRLCTKLLFSSRTVASNAQFRVNIAICCRVSRFYLAVSNIVSHERESSLLLFLQNSQRMLAYTDPIDRYRLPSYS
jgi:hypothetical protein